MHYEKITVTSTYAPWLSPEFTALHTKLRGATLVDIYRCYELYSLAKQVNHFDASILEVGVWRGGTAGILAHVNNGVNNLYLCDTFSGVVKTGEKDSQYKGGEHADCSIDNVKYVLSLTNPNKVKILQGIFPEDTASQIPSEEVFKFAHIDVDVYQSTKDILEWVWEKLVVGGVVVFDDYGVVQCDGVTKIVNEYLSRTDRVTTYNLNGHAVMVKTK